MPAQITAQCGTPMGTVVHDEASAFLKFRAKTLLNDHAGPSVGPSSRGRCETKEALDAVSCTPTLYSMKAQYYRNCTMVCLNAHLLEDTAGRRPSRLIERPRLSTSVPSTPSNVCYSALATEHALHLIRFVCSSTPPYCLAGSLHTAGSR